MMYPREALHHLANDFRVYWQRVLSDNWSNMVKALESDILYRGRQLAIEGPKKLLADLHGTISFKQDQIQIEPSLLGQRDTHYSLRGDGIQLIPLFFIGAGRGWIVEPEWRPALGYRARGIGSYLLEAPKALQSLELAMGAGRARVLQSLTTPATTGELARKLHVSAATVSQHLHRLTEAGLVQPQRAGKRVYYQLTQRGESLLTLFDSTG